METNNKKYWLEIGLNENNPRKDDNLGELRHSLHLTNLILNNIYSVLNFFRIIFIILLTATPIILLIALLLR